jgi:serine kinase of HPr protein (carbohydrate metabolism regulator)
MTHNRIHATSVAIGGRAVLLMGPSGSGKSDLALRLIDRGATLVSDDYTALTNISGTLHAAAPPTIAGKIEVRGLGILEISHIDDVPVALLVRLGARIERMPPDGRTMTLEGICLPMIALDAFEASAPIKVQMALRCGKGS